MKYVETLSHKAYELKLYLTRVKTAIFPLSTQDSPRIRLVNLLFLFFPYIKVLVEMQPLLTIGIPTYNRAKFLQAQLKWLAEAVKGFEEQCEVFVSDNCSTDETSKVIEEWEKDLHEINFRWNRNDQNVGLMNNIKCCMEAASGKYIWTIGDDDPISPEAIGYVVKTLTSFPNLTWLNLNFSCRDGISDKLIFERCYAVEVEQVYEDGKTIFQNCLRLNNSGVGVMTAQVYRSDLARQALQSWPNLINGEVQVFWTGYCAFHGSVAVSKNTYFEYVAGTASWMRNKKQLLRMHYTYLPEVFVKISDIGYPKEFCRSLIMNHFFKNNWRVFFGAMRRWPILTTKVISRYLLLFCRVCFCTNWPFVKYL